jgi:hypothetical protein
MNQKLFCILGISILFTATCLAMAEETITHQELVSRTQELFEGVTTANNAAWIKYYADDCLFHDEKGRSMDKATLVKEITQLPKGYRLKFALENTQSRITSNVAVLSYDIVEDLWIYDQKVGAKFHTTDTWLLRNGTWQIVASESMRYYGDPAPGRTDPARYSEYAGTYELAPGVTLTVSTESGNLYYQRGDNAKEQLIAEVEGLFFRKGVEGRILFRSGKDGKIDALISRRNHEDLIWRKMEK